MTEKICRFAVCLLLGLSIFSVRTNAAENLEKQDGSKKSDQPEAAPVRHESWYFNFGLGYAIPGYTSETKQVIDSLKGLSGYSRTPVAVDIGAYFPVGNSASVLGPALFGIADDIKVSGFDFNIIQSALGLSGEHFFNGVIGDGFYVRGDLALARYSFKATDPSGATFSQARSKFGFAAQAGLGYAFPVGQKLKLTLVALYSHFNADSEKTDNITINGSIFF
jgi:hypothetical protein